MHGWVDQSAKNYGHANRAHGETYKEWMDTQRKMGFLAAQSTAAKEAAAEYASVQEFPNVRRPFHGHDITLCLDLRSVHGPSMIVKHLTKQLSWGSELVAESREEVCALHSLM